MNNYDALIEEAEQHADEYEHDLNRPQLAGLLRALARALKAKGPSGKYDDFDGYDGDLPCIFCGRTNPRYGLGYHTTVPERIECHEWFLCAKECQRQRQHAENQREELSMLQALYNYYKWFVKVYLGRGIDLTLRLKRLKRVAEGRRAQYKAAEDAMRELAFYLGVGGYNSPHFDAEDFRKKIRWGIDHLCDSNLAPRPSDLAEKQDPQKPNAAQEDGAGTPSTHGRRVDSSMPEGEAEVNP